MEEEALAFSIAQEAATAATDPNNWVVLV